MATILYRAFRHLACRVWDALNPRAMRWRWIQKHHPDKPIITRLGRSLKVRIYPHDVIGKAIYVNRVFEKAESRFVTKFLKPGLVFFDAGANLGQYTLLAARCVAIDGKVHSFEPSSRMFSELKYNVELNGISNICTLNNVAISDTEGTAKLSLYEPGAEVYCSLGAQHRGNASIIGDEVVKTTTLDTYVEEKSIDHVDLIKMDIEGAELLALRGGEHLLSQAHAPVIVLEMSSKNTRGFGYTVLDIWEYLEHLRYAIYYFDRRGNICGLAEPPLGSPKRENFVAIKKGQF